MFAPGVQVTLFASTDDGYLIAFAASQAVRRIVAQAIISLDPWQRVWIPELHAWWISDDAISRLARWLPSVADALAAWHARPVDVSDEVRRIQAEALNRARRKVVVPPEIAEAYASLGLQPGASAEEVAAARRVLARQHHPDTGGDHTRMVAINSAADKVTKWLVQAQ